MFAYLLTVKAIVKQALRIKNIYVEIKNWTQVDPSPTAPHPQHTHRDPCTHTRIRTHTHTHTHARTHARTHTQGSLQCNLTICRASKAARGKATASSTTSNTASSNTARRTKVTTRNRTEVKVTVKVKVRTATARSGRPASVGWLMPGRTRRMTANSRRRRKKVSTRGVREGTKRSK